MDLKKLLDGTSSDRQWRYFSSNDPSDQRHFTLRHIYKAASQFNNINLTEHDFLGIEYILQRRFIIKL